MTSTQQLTVLEHLGVQTWLPRQANALWFKEVLEPHYLVAVDETAWQTPQTQVLCFKILEALSWPLDQIGVLNSAQYDGKMPKKQGIVFGQSLSNLSEPWILLPSLFEIQKSKEVKRQAWQRLKPYQIK